MNIYIYHRHNMWIYIYMNIMYDVCTYTYIIYFYTSCIYTSYISHTHIFIYIYHTVSCMYINVYIISHSYIYISYLYIHIHMDNIYIYMCSDNRSSLWVGPGNRANHHWWCWWCFTGQVICPSSKGLCYTVPQAKYRLQTSQPCLHIHQSQL